MCVCMTLLLSYVISRIYGNISVCQWDFGAVCLHCVFSPVPREEVVVSVALIKPHPGAFSLQRLSEIIHA